MLSKVPPRRASVRCTCNYDDVEQVRVDRWLWAILICSSRSQATDACRGGHVRVNGRPAKPATPVRTGDRVSARVHGRQRELEVVDPIERRVGAPIAVTCYVDHSPSPAPAERIPPPLVRDRAAGRPTKKDRRAIDRFRER